MKKFLTLVPFCGAACFFALSQTPALAQGSDQSFVDFAAQTDMTEAHFGQMVADHSDSQAVKDYGQMLTTDHTNDYQQLSTVAAKANLNVPKGLDAMHDRMIAPFEKLKGAAFDRRFEHEMVIGHEKAIAEYKKEAADGQNADLKAYAQQALPVLEKHKSAAESLEKGGK